MSTAPDTAMRAIQGTPPSGDGVRVSVRLSLEGVAVAARGHQPSCPEKGADPIVEVSESAHSDTKEALEEIPRRTPVDFHEWHTILMNPGKYFDLSDEERRLLAAPPSFNQEVIKKNGVEGLIQSRLPFLNEEERKTLLASHEWPQIRNLLLIFETRFIPRIPGIVLRLGRAARHLCRGRSWVGLEKKIGIKFEFDLKGSTQRAATEGPEAVANDLAQHLYAPLFKILASYPGVQLAQAVGDAPQLVSSDQRMNPVAFLTHARQAMQTDVHATAGYGEFGIAYTPHGRIIVIGKASERNQRAQKRSKKYIGDETCLWICDGDERIHQFNASESFQNPPPPQKLALQFGKGVDRETLKRKYSTNPGQLLKDLRTMMALIASGTSLHSLQTSETVERSTMCLYAIAPDEATSDDLNQQYQALCEWEQLVESLARQYDARVKHIEGANGEKIALIHVGGEGSLQVGKERRALLLAQALLKQTPRAKIAIKEGDVRISTMAGQVRDAQSNAFNQAAKAARHLPEGIIGMDQKTLDHLASYGLQLQHPHQKIVELKGLGKVQLSYGREFREPKRHIFTRRELTTDIAGKICTEAHWPTTTGNDIMMRHWDLTGGTTGQTAIIQTVAQELMKSGIQMVVLPEQSESHLKPYQGVATLLKVAFPSLLEFQAWLGKTPASVKQKASWGKLYNELQSPVSEATLLNQPNFAKPALTNLLRSMGENFGIACPDWPSLDEYSQEIFLNCEARLLTRGSDATGAKKIDIPGMGVEEALQFAAYILEAPLATLADHANPLREYLSRLNEGEGMDPLALEMHIRALLQTKALKKESIIIDLSKTKGVTASAQLSVIVNDRMDQLYYAQAKSLLQIAAALEPIHSKKELTLAASPPITEIESAVQDLVRTGLLLNGASRLRFPSSSVARNVREHSTQDQLPDETRHFIESNIRTKGIPHIFSASRYLTICNRLELAMHAKPTQYVFDHLSTLPPLEIMDLGQHYAKMLPEEPTDIMTKNQISQILSIYATLIETKIFIGEDVEEDLNKAFAFLKASEKRNHDQTNWEFHKKVLFGLSCEAAHREQDLNKHSLAIAAFRQHYSETDCAPPPEFHLREAEFEYRQAGSLSLEATSRLQATKNALICLQKIPDEATCLTVQKNRFALQVEGYDLLELRNTLEKVQNYINRVEIFFKKNPTNDSPKAREANLQLRLFLARAYMTTPNGMENGIRLAKEITEEAKQEGFVDAALKGLNYEMTAYEIQGDGAVQSGDFHSAFTAWRAMETPYRETLRLTENTKGETPLDVTILTSLVTWLICLLNQILNHASQNRPSSDLPLIIELEKVWNEVLTYKNSAAWANLSKYIDPQKSTIESYLQRIHRHEVVSAA